MGCRDFCEKHTKHIKTKPHSMSQLKTSSLLVTTWQSSKMHTASYVRKFQTSSRIALSNKNSELTSELPSATEILSNNSPCSEAHATARVRVRKHAKHERKIARAYITVNREIGLVKCELPMYSVSLGLP